MNKEDIEHLAKLSRIAVTDAEASALADDISSILGYVSEINEIAGEKPVSKEVGALYNVMREDGEPHASGIFTEDLLAQAPDRAGQYVRVKKIIADKS